MSMFFHDHSDEGFDEEWAKSMRPTWDKQALVHKAEQAEWDALSSEQQEATKQDQREYWAKSRTSAVNNMFNAMKNPSQPSPEVQAKAAQDLVDILR